MLVTRWPGEPVPTEACAARRVRFTGPLRSTLSGARLEAGLDVDSMEFVPEQAFFGELTAQAELVQL